MFNDRRRDAHLLDGIRDRRNNAALALIDGRVAYRCCKCSQWNVDWVSYSAHKRFLSDYIGGNRGGLHEPSKNLVPPQRWQTIVKPSPPSLPPPARQTGG